MVKKYMGMKSVVWYTLKQFYSYIYCMKILKWLLFTVFVLVTIFCVYIVYEFYFGLSFIDYPYVIGAIIFSVLSILMFNYKPK